jgi:hypothetical protein
VSVAKAIGGFIFEAGFMLVKSAQTFAQKTGLV